MASGLTNATVWNDVNDPEQSVTVLGYSANVLNGMFMAFTTL